MNYEIIPMEKKHWEQVKKIYIEGIETGIATFTTVAPSFEKWDDSHLKVCRFVAVNNYGQVMGWIALSPTSSAPAYSGSTEVSIYIGKDFRKNGIGKALMNKIKESAEKNGIWSLYSCIIRENKMSLELHKKCGFREIGIRERIAKLSNGKWSDTVLMEYRSKKIGLD